MLEFSFLDTSVHILTTPETYAGAVVGAFLRKIARLFVLLASFITITQGVYQVVKKYPKILSVAIIFLVVALFVSGCSNVQPLPPVGSEQVYEKTYTVLGESYCNERKKEFKHSLGMRTSSCDPVKTFISSGKPKDELSAQEDAQLKRCLSSMNRFVDAKRDYVNCIDHFSDNNVIFNPFNIYR